MDSGVKTVQVFSFTPLEVLVYILSNPSLFKLLFTPLHFCLKVLKTPKFKKMSFMSLEWLD